MPDDHATPTPRHTRGPRTPQERATDAARKTATLFEQLPSSSTGDHVLKPLAVMLRFDAGTTYLDPDSVAEVLEAWESVKTWGESHEVLAPRPEGARELLASVARLRRYVEQLVARTDELLGVKPAGRRAGLTLLPGGEG
jgi:hypothetical protein